MLALNSGASMLLVERLGRGRIGGVVVADHGERRIPEVLDRRSFTQELRIHRHAEALAVLLARSGFQCRNHRGMRRPREHGAADDDHVVGVLVLEDMADFLADASQVRQVEAAVLPAWRPDAQQRQVGRAHRILGAGGCAQAPRRHSPLQQLLEPRLDDRAAPGVDRRHFFREDVHAHYFMPIVGERCRGHATDIPETKNGNLHDLCALS